MASDIQAFTVDEYVRVCFLKPSYLLSTSEQRLQLTSFVFEGNNKRFLSFLKCMPTLTALKELSERMMLKYP